MNINDILRKEQRGFLLTPTERTQLAHYRNKQTITPVADDYDHVTNAILAATIVNSFVASTPSNDTSSSYDSGSSFGGGDSGGGGSSSDW